MLLSKHIQLPYISPSYQPPPAFHLNIPSFKKVLVNSIDIIQSIHPTYYLVTFGFICVFVFMYIKIKYPFWNGQPVYHIYDIWRQWSTEPYIIHVLPLKTKYYDKMKLVETYKYQDIDRPRIQEIVKHLQHHYIPSDRIIYNLEEADFRSYFGGQSETSYISVFNQIIFTNDATKPTNWDELVNSQNIQKTVIGHISSRYVHLYMLNKQNTMTEYGAYLQDFVCLHRNKPQNIRTLFDTHVYNHRVLNPDVKISILKYENELLDGVVPLVKYESRTYFLRIPHFNPLPSNYNLVQVTKTTTDVLHDFWNGFLADTSLPPSLFECMVFPEIGNVLSLIKSHNMWVFCLKRGDYVYAIYVLKNAHTNYEEMDDNQGNGGNTLYLVASLCNTDSPDLFMHGFLQSVREVLRIHPYYKMLMMDVIGHNIGLVQKWELTGEPVIKTPAAYYLYNMVCPRIPLLPSKCFIVV
jgi:hypothetical protein